MRKVNLFHSSWSLVCSSIRLYLEMLKGLGIRDSLLQRVIENLAQMYGKCLSFFSWLPTSHFHHPHAFHQPP